jgi:hypothetical protein
VLWINLLYQSSPQLTPLSAYKNATYVVGASDSPAGPFAVVKPSAAVQAGGGGDFTLLVDNGTAYIAYDAWSNQHTIKVEQLDDRYYNSVLSPTTPLVAPSGNEAPLFFQRNGWYYLIYGHTCCFCSGGAGARVLTAPHPLGEWTDSKVELNPRKALSFDHMIPSQNNYVFQATVTVQNPTARNTTAVEYIFTADLWTSAPDKLKSHDRQFWAPLMFDDSVSPPTIQPLKWIDAFALDLA